MSDREPKNVYGAMSDALDTTFYAPPPTVKRHRGFFRGLTVRGVKTLADRRNEQARRQADMPNRERQHGEREPSKQQRKLRADAGVRRLSLPKRKRLLARMCAAAGVQNAAGLAAKKR